MTEKVLVPLLCGHLLVPLETLPRDGHVAYTVWPCSSFLINSLAGWRIRSREHESQKTLDAGGRIATHMESWSQLDDPAKGLILQRSKWTTIMNGVRVVDLGSGTGIAGIALHAMGASLVIATDMPKCMSLLETNVAAWNKVHDNRGGVLVAAPLAWERYRAGDLNQLLEEHVSTASANVDILVACDCVYGTEHIGRSPIVPIVSDFLLSTELTSRIVFIAYESRDDDIEESFWYQIDQHENLGHAVVNACDAEAGEGNEKKETTYQIHAIFKR
jgi:hypothetical protein